MSWYFTENVKDSRNACVFLLKNVYIRIDDMTMNKLQRPVNFQAL